MPCIRQLARTYRHIVLRVSRLVDGDIQRDDRVATYAISNRIGINTARGVILTVETDHIACGICLRSRCYRCMVNRQVKRHDTVAARRINQSVDILAAGIILLA